MSWNYFQENDCSPDFLEAYCFCHFPFLFILLFYKLKIEIMKKHYVVLSSENRSYQNKERINTILRL